MRALRSTVEVDVPVEPTPLSGLNTRLVRRLATRRLLRHHTLYEKYSAEPLRYAVAPLDTFSYSTRTSFRKIHQSSQLIK